MKETMERQHGSNEVNLFGQRWHVCVGLFYFGLGVFLAGGIHRWIPGGADWLSLVGLVMLFGATAWWLLLWRQQRSRA
jgi:hypothetical protein